MSQTRQPDIAEALAAYMASSQRIAALLNRLVEAASQRLPEPPPRL